MEQPLPKHGACNLCSINVSEYVVNPYTKDAFVDYPHLIEDVQTIVFEMDKVLEENLDRHALPEQKAMALKYRNIGIGIMGLADMFVKLNITYGKEESINLTHSLMKLIFRTAIYASVDNGKKLGSFPEYSSKVWDSHIIKNAFSLKEIEQLKNTDCLRNCSLLSIAPTGSIGTMLNISTGVEPFFALSYNRRTESLDNKTFKVDIKAVQEYKKITDNKELSKHFVISAEISWKERIDIQAALQEFCDTAISSTVNLPKETTVDDIKELYKYAWKKGCKGITVYRQGSREGILTTEDTPTEIPVTKAPKRPKELKADCYSIKVKGEQFIVVVGLLNDKPYEVFAFKVVNYINIPDHKGIITKEQKGKYSFKSEYFNIDNLVSEMEPEEQAVTLYCSMLLRHGIDIEFVKKTTKKVNNLINSFSSAICRVLSKYITESSVGKCPKCGGNLIFEGGCYHCNSCEYSKCE